MAEEQFTIGWIDDTGTTRNCLLRIDDELCLLRLNEYVRVNSSKYTLDRIHRMTKFDMTSNEPGAVVAYYFGRYRDNDGNEIEEITENYTQRLSNDLRVDYANWTDKQIHAAAANEMVSYLFGSKKVFDVDANNKPLEPLVFTHPCLVEVTSTLDTGVGDGTITVRPRGGTAPFDVMIGNDANWIEIIGNTHTFTGLTGEASGNTNPYRIDLRDQSSPVQRSIPFDAYV